ncbi:MAG TPA: gliding motility-associated C-terminal domain-containing protein, partial [Saprospiraceae bacterium]|nr:gliding motility-associated C-terminal domain-containing protein [Saprospiraceae bacterium]
MRLYILPLLVCMMLAVPAVAQRQFILNGQARIINDSCYQLTPETNFVAGSIWNSDKISLLQSFDVVARVYLGCKDGNGADGMVFGFQPVSTSIGTAGGGIGFANIVPSIGIEIDTHYNSDFGDPTYDHIAITRNGNVNHNSGNTLAGPVQARATSSDIEDCKYYDLRVSWNAPLKRLQVYFDCVLRLTYTGDIVNQVFGGDPWVFWGFTAATGGLNNVHQVCFEYTSFLDQLEDVTICPGAHYPLRIRGGASYRWSPETGLSNPNIANPIASPESTTTYTVEVLDACNRPFYDSITITVSGDSLLVNLQSDSILCEGTTQNLDAGASGDRYSWSTGEQTRFLPVTQPGTYEVTVSWNNPFCISVDEVTLVSKPQPQASLGRDTTLCEGQSIRYLASFPEATYLWSDGSAADTLWVRAPGVYTLAVSNDCGTAIDGVRVDYENCREVYFPNAFSPNDDGINDTFGPLHGGDVSEVHLLRVFDRWGGLVFEWKGDSDRLAWDGRLKNKPLPQGVYVFWADLTFRDGHRAAFSGE